MEGHNESVSPAAAEHKQTEAVTTVGAIDAAAEHEEAKAAAAAVATDAAAYREAAERVRQTGEKAAAARRRMVELEQARKGETERQRQERVARLDQQAEELKSCLHAALAPIREGRQAEDLRHSQALKELAQREAAVRRDFAGAEIALKEVRAGRSVETAERIAKFTLDIAKVREEYPESLGRDLAEAQAAMRSAEHAVNELQALRHKPPGQYEGQVAALAAATERAATLECQRSERDGRLELLGEELEALKRTGV